MQYQVHTKNKAPVNDAIDESQYSRKIIFYMVRV